MKQHLFQDDLATLTEAQKLAWWRYILGPKSEPSDPGSDRSVALGSSIGKMIEFLMTTDYYRDGMSQFWLDISGLDHVIEDRNHMGMDDTLGIGWKGDELCDRLWECVKVALCPAVE